MLRASRKATSGAIIWPRFLRHRAIGSSSSARTHDRAAGEVAVAAQVLGRGVDHEVGAERQRVLVHGRCEGAVHDRDGARAVRGLGDRRDVDELELGIGGRLEEHDARAVGEDVRQALHFADEKERRVDPDLGQVDAEQLEGAAVDVADADDVLTGVGVGQEGGRLGRHARREREGRSGALQVRQLALHRLDRGVEPVAGVERPRPTALDDVEQVGRARRRRRWSGCTGACGWRPAGHDHRRRGHSESRAPDERRMARSRILPKWCQSLFGHPRCVPPRLPAEVQRGQVPLDLLEVVTLEGELQVVVGGATPKGRDVARRQEGIGADVEGDVAGVA